MAFLGLAAPKVGAGARMVYEARATVNFPAKPA